MAEQKLTDQQLITKALTGSIEEEPSMEEASPGGFEATPMTQEPTPTSEAEDFRKWLFGILGRAGKTTLRSIWNFIKNDPGLVAARNIRAAKKRKAARKLRGE